MSEQDEQASVETEANLPTVSIFYVDGVPNYTCQECNEGFDDLRAHFDAKHPGVTKYRKNVVGFACGRKSMGGGGRTAKGKRR